MNSKLLCMVLTILVVKTGLVHVLKVDGRISNGFPGVDEERFTVRIISAIDENATQGYLSTGVAVTPTHVVTVAQAIAGFSIWRIGYGSVHIAEQYLITTRYAEHHPNFDPALSHNNVGVIRVPYILPNWHYHEIGFESTLHINYVLGFGFINDELVLASTLQGASVWQASADICSNYFNDTIVGDNLCAISFTSQIKNGDQGGPALNNYLNPITAIISFWGSTEETPIVLVDLRQHREFLEAQFNL